MTKAQYIAALRLLGWETYICAGNERPAALRMSEPNSFEGYTFTPKTSVLHSVGKDQLSFVRAHVPGMVGILITGRPYTSPGCGRSTRR